MTIQKISIPDKCKVGKPLFCGLTPPTINASIRLYLKGESDPFAVGQLSRRSNEIALHMFRPQTFSDPDHIASEPLKPGDVVTVKVIAANDPKDKATETKDVTLTE